MGVRGRAAAEFLKLPSSLQRRILHLLGKSAPWEPGFDHNAPPVQPGLLPGPPDFVGVGVQKAGTSWWYSLIVQHPDVYQHDGFHKERHFFGRFCLDEFMDDDVLQYHRWFPRPPDQLTGEWTPDYLHQYWVPPLLHESAPAAKLLVILRDPLERYRSGLDHYGQRGEALTPELLTDAFARGLYAESLARLESVFSPQRVLVLQYEACAEAPRRFLAQTFRFLELDETFADLDVDRPVNATRGRSRQLPAHTRARLADLYQEDLRSLASRYPELDLDRWPTFSHRTSPMSGQ